MNGRRLFGAGGAPSDHILLPAFFLFYVSAAGPGAWSLDRLLGRDAGSASAEQTRLAAYSPRRAAHRCGVPVHLSRAWTRCWARACRWTSTSLRALAGVLELVGGPMLMLGLFTRPLAFLLSGEMAFAYFMNHAPDGFWGSFVEPNQEAAILNCFLFLFLWGAGPGAWSLDGAAARVAVVHERQSIGRIAERQFARLVSVGGGVRAARRRCASAQSSIVGVVRDASGGVLPGVTVEAASPGPHREGPQRHRPTRRAATASSICGLDRTP